MQQDQDSSALDLNDINIQTGSNISSVDYDVIVIGAGLSGLVQSSISKY
jgi:hypothetical protein